MNDSKNTNDSPLSAFSECHAGFTAHLRELRDLPQLLAQADRARDIAQRTLELFNEGVLAHHEDEEKELFPAVERSACPGAEMDGVAAMVERLTREHRMVERLWKQVAHQVRDAARGKPVKLDAQLVEDLVTAYLLHANFEEQYFLPLAGKILARNGNHMAALDMSLHLRHAHVPSVGYI